MNLSIRLATIDEAELIADISRQAFYDTFAAWNSPENMDQFLRQQFTKGKLMLEVGRPENTFFLAFLDDEVAGYVKLRGNTRPSALPLVPTLEIARLYALAPYIGKGVGRLLMHTSLELARQKGKKIAWLGVWEKNSHAIGFYRKWGFEKFAETDFLLGSEVQCDWLMKKEL